MDLNKKYERSAFLSFLKNSLVEDFNKDIRLVNTDSLTSIKKAFSLGKSEALNLQIFEFEFTGSSRKRVTLTKEAFKLMRDSACYQALAVFHSVNSETWRFSFLTADPVRTDKGSVGLVYSNPKRYSFLLGFNAKVNTPYKYLVDKGKIVDLQDLKKRFSIEVVNKDFYKEVSSAFTHLVEGKLKLPSTQNHGQTNLEFAVRLIGRIIFCWFLREKRSSTGHSLMPSELISDKAVKEISNYYHKILEPIFFEILNRPIKSRKDSFSNNIFAAIPYLNGGLFSPHEDDYYSYNEGKQAINHNLVVVPDEWLKSFFEVLETYNFTIDENTSYDEELSIDPEMLGRIFENLLAEINPETGESARKSTGSYYTPRVIVDYMIDESLILYLKEKTQIEEEKLRALVSYDLDDDLSNPLTEKDKEIVTDSLDNVKILDPACGSGAFPIGALQKIVFILQQIDPQGQLWFKKQIHNTSVELKRLIEKEFQEKNFDYLRKLGIIRKNIYGVDIQPIATEISRLRCFLTLVVDERIDDSLGNRGIEPLPNLDFKFVTANTLIGLPKITEGQQELFDDNEKIEQLKSLREQYFSARSEERKDMMIEFSDLQSEMINELIDRHSFTGAMKAELTRKLTDWKPFKHKINNWFDPEWMFGIKNGFDIVIANPPYGVSLKDEYRNEVLKFSNKVPDFEIYYFFIERANQFLANSGILDYIIPNTILFNVFAKSFRSKLTSEFEISCIIDCTNVKLFEHATVRNCILILRKNVKSDKVGYIKTSDISTVEELTNQKKQYMSVSNLLENNTNWGLAFKLESNVLNLIAKIRKQNKLLQYYPEISQGLIAYDKYRGQSQEIIKNRAYHYFSNLKPGLKKWLNGEDINRFNVFWNSKEYIDYCDGIANPRDPKYFVGERVLVREITNPSIYAAFTDEELYNDPSILIVKANKDHSATYLAGILNSKLATFYHFNASPKATKGDFPKILIKDLQEFPLAIGDFSLRKQIDDIANRLATIVSVQKDPKHPNEAQCNLENILNNLVYQLYNLNNDEIKIVEEGDIKLL